MQFPGLVGGSLRSRSPLADCEMTWNWYVEVVESQSAKASPVLYPTPGFTPFAALPTSPVRGLWAQDNRAFAVAGDSLYELFTNGSIALRPPTALVMFMTPTVTPSTPIAALPTMPMPVIYVNGGNGPATYGYQVTAINILGETPGSPEGLTLVGPTTLSLSNNIVVTWRLVPNATGYKVYRTRGGIAPPRLIATIADPLQSVFTDSGQPGTAATVPTANTSGSPGFDTNWGYQVVATNLTGSTDGSYWGLHMGYPVLSAQHYNTVSWAPIANAVGYDVYRVHGGAVGTVPPNTVVLIAQIPQSDAPQIIDTGLPPVAGSDIPAVPPTVNTSKSDGFPGGSSPVSMASSGDAGRQLLIAAGGRGYVFDLDSNALTAVVNDVSQVGFIDGYFVGLDGGTSTFKMSNYLDGLTWDPTQIAQRNVAGDKWLSMIVAHREIWLLGEQTSEVWVNLGTSPFPFGPNQNVFMMVGCAALFSPVLIGDGLMWVGQSADGVGFIVRPDGYTPTRVSTHALETALQNYHYLADGEAWSYQQDGHVFYVLTLPTSNLTWVYDFTSRVWAQRGVWNPAENRFDAYRARCHCYAFGGLGSGMHLVGDRLTGTVYVMALDVGVDIGGGVIRRARRAPHLHSDLLSIAYRRLQVDLEVGLGLVAGQGSDPQAMLRWSDDGSKTWSNEHWTSAGKQGAYRTRAKWTRLGAARDRVFELVVTDPIPWRVIDATLAVEPGTS